MRIDKTNIRFGIPRANGLKKRQERMQAERERQIKRGRPQADQNDISSTDREKLSIVSRVTEELANKDYEGERIINKARAGKKLNFKEEQYLAEKSPELYEKYKSAQMEREALRRQMECAKDKMGVAICYSGAVEKADKISESSVEREMRMNQLRDEYNEYVKTDNYKEKADNPFEDEEEEDKKHINTKA